MDRKQGASQDLLSEVKILIENNKVLELRELLEEYHIIDIFDIMEHLEDNMKIKLFEVLPIDMAASILEESDAEFFSTILSKIDIEHRKNILELMSLDDMADILSKLEDEEREEVMDLLSQEDAEDVKELLFYEEESNGGIMTTGYLEVNKDMTVKQAIEHMRENAQDADTIYYTYVVDNDERLVGVLSLRELITARDSVVVEDLMSENIISVYVDDDREEAVRLVSKYNLIAIPVIDRDRTLKGIITVDDIIDVMEEEASEDMYKFAGTSEQERDVVEKVNPKPKEQIISSVKGRIPWLIITLIAGLLSTIMLSNLDFIMNPTYASLVFFIPVVMGMGGNIGTQSSALTVMALSNKDDIADIDLMNNQVLQNIIDKYTAMYNKLEDMYNWYETAVIKADDVIDYVTLLKVDDFDGAIVPRSYKLYEPVAKEFAEFCKANNKYKIQDILSQFIREGIDKYSYKLEDK